MMYYTMIKQINENKKRYRTVKIIALIWVLFIGIDVVIVLL